MKKIFLLLILAVSLTNAQTKCKKAVIYSSSDYKSARYDESGIKNIRHAFWSDSLVVNSKNERKLYGPYKIWGYRDNDCQVYRNFNADFYKIEQYDSLVIYTQTFYPSFWDFPNIFYFFSKTLDSPIYKLTHSNLENEFRGSTCFLEKVKKDIKWYEDYSVLDRKKHIYKIIELYKDCAGK